MLGSKDALFSEVISTQTYVSVKIEEALSILDLDKIPSTQEEITSVYRDRAKQMHPDTGGSESEFKDLQKATDVVRAALDLVLNSVEQLSDKEAGLKAKRDKMREEMLKRRAKEDRKRNIQATWGIGIITTIVTLLLLGYVTRPMFNEWVVGKDQKEAMAEVVFTDHTKVFEISWEYAGETYTESVRGRLIDGRWLVGDAGMPILKGAKYIVAFNAANPSYFILKDQYIHPETAEVYYAIMKHPLAEILDVPVGDKAIVCAYWNILDQFGVDGLAHILFSQLPIRKNWSHNKTTFKTLGKSEDFQNLLRSCLPDLEEFE